MYVEEGEVTAMRSVWSIDDEPALSGAERRARRQRWAGIWLACFVVLIGVVLLLFTTRH